MEKAVTASYASRKFSQLLHEVRKGRSYIVTSHGKPVAKLGPIEETGKPEISARDALLSRLKRQPVITIGHWTRDELYEDAE